MKILFWNTQIFFNKSLHFFFQTHVSILFCFESSETYSEFIMSKKKVNKTQEFDSKITIETQERFPLDFHFKIQEQIENVLLKLKHIKKMT